MQVVAGLAVALDGASRSSVPLCAGARYPSPTPPAPRAGPDRDTDLTKAKCYEIADSLPASER